MSEAKYKRILLKLSGEALAGDSKKGIDPNVIGEICDEIKKVKQLGVEIAIVVGGGNFWRGRNGKEMERTTSDYMSKLFKNEQQHSSLPQTPFPPIFLTSSLTPICLSSILVL